MAPMPESRTRLRAPPGLPVYVCEYHDEALRCLHHAIRKRYLPFNGLSLVHLDSHPDLSASSTMPAETVLQDPRGLYSALRSDPGGIAQWILPAVYGGHLRCVWWVRPEWAEQIADGDYDVAVGHCQREGAPATHTRDARTTGRKEALRDGADTALMSDDPVPSTSAGQADTEPRETLRISCNQPYFVEDGLYCPEGDLLAVQPLRLRVSRLEASPGELAGTWVLDVCLDFFACGNPFVNGTRPRVAAACAAVHNAAAFRQRAVQDVVAFQADCAAFDAVWAAVLSGEAADEALGRFLPEDRQRALLAELRMALSAATDAELQQLVDAGDMVSLPLHPASATELEGRLAEVEAFVRRLRTKPSVVTIARSVVDGFCPMRWLCLLERGVLELLQRCFGVLELVYVDELEVLERV